MTRIFAHCCVSVPYARQLAAVRPEFDRYPERALVLAEPDDIVCLPGPIDRGYLEFLEALGIGPAPDDVLVVPHHHPGERFYPLCRRMLEAPEVLAQIVERLQKTRRGFVHPFITSDDHVALAAELAAMARVPVTVAGGSPALVARADRKDEMRIQAQALGLPVAPGEAVRLAHPRGRRRGDTQPLRDAIVRRMDATGRVIVRGASGASGSSVYVVGRGGSDIASVIDEVVRRADNDAYLVEVMVETTASPNVQMYIAPESGAVTCAGLTEQRWSRPLAHAGNLFPCDAAAGDSIVHWAYRFTEWLRDEGYRGFVGLDFVEYRDLRTAEPRVLFAEVNPRVNGSTFPLVVRERLNQRQRASRLPESAAFGSAAVETTARSFGELQTLIGHLLYRRETGAGVIPYSSAFLPSGKYLAVVLGHSCVEIQEALAELQRASMGIVQTDAPSMAGVS